MTAHDLRVLMAISLHDGMSLKKGSGGGCYAKHETLWKMIGSDAARFSRSLKRLVDTGYVTKEDQQGDARRKTLRVDFSVSDTCQREQLSREAAENDTLDFVDSGDNHFAEIVDHPGNLHGELVDNRDRENSGFSSEIAPHYTPLRGKLDSVKTDGLDSVETARPSVALHDVQDLVSKAGGQLRTDARSPLSQKKDGAKARATEWARLATVLPSDFETLSAETRLEKVEKAVAQFGGIARLHPADREKLCRWLCILAEEFPGVSPWAGRLMAAYVPEAA